MDNDSRDNPSPITSTEDRIYAQPQKDYAIVLFTKEDNAPGIVLSTWIFDNGQRCSYPAVKTNEARDNLLKKKSEPQKSWSSNAIKILNFYETFAEARAHLRKAEDTSNLSSDEETWNSQRPPRKRIERNIVLPGEEETTDDEVHQPKLKSSVKSKMSHLEKEVPYPLPITLRRSSATPHMFNKSSVPPATTTAVQHSSEERQISSRHESFDSLSSGTALCAGCVKQNIINTELREMLANMCTMLQRVEAKVDALQGGRLAEPIDEEEQAIFVNLPAKNAEDFEAMEEKLRGNGHFQQKFAKRMASVGGRSSRCLIQNMLKSLLTDSVAETYSLSGKAGKNQEKKAFASTEAFKIMSLACKKIYKEETDTNISGCQRLVKPS